MTYADPAPLPPPATYPDDGADVHHGLRVWEMGEDGALFLVEGNDRRRALAAFSSYRRRHRVWNVRWDDADVHADEDCRWWTLEYSDDPEAQDWVWRIHPSGEGWPGALPFLRIELL